MVPLFRRVQQLTNEAFVVEPVGADSNVSVMGSAVVGAQAVLADAKPSSVVSVQMPVTRNTYSVLGSKPGTK